MPIYEYLCQACGSKFEKLVRRSDEHSVLAEGCPTCGKPDLKQEYSTFAPRAGNTSSAPEMGGCPAGMCSNPGLCGRN